MFRILSTVLYDIFQSHFPGIEHFLKQRLSVLFTLELLLFFMVVNREYCCVRNIVQ
jgi:hypothetical protein